MKFQLSAGIVLAISTMCIAQQTDPKPAGYKELYDACKAKSGTTYVGVRYSGKTGIVTYAYDDCYPYQLFPHQTETDTAKLAVFCRPALCYNYATQDCSGNPIIVPGFPGQLGVPFVDGAFLPDVLDFVLLIGTAAKCAAL